MLLIKNYPYLKSMALVVMAFLFGLSETKGQDKEIVRDTTFTIEVEKDTFLVHEPICLIIKKINITQKSEFINEASFSVCLTVRDSKGKNYSPSLMPYSTTRSELKPGDSLVVTLDLAKDFGERHGISLVNYSLPAEKYKIYGSLEGEHRIIRTNEIDITISEPEGDER